jgi:hypothetical protein
MVKNVNFTVDHEKKSFWLPETGEPLKIIFNPSDYAQNMPLEWAKFLVRKEGTYPYRTTIKIIFVIFVMGSLFIFWHYKQWKDFKKLSS